MRGRRWVDVPGLEQDLARTRAERDALSARLAAIEASTTWRLSAGIRGVVERSPALSRLARGTARVLGRKKPAMPVHVEPEATTIESEAPNGAGLVLAPSPQPTVSIVVPTYGQVAATLACLRSIAACPPSDPYEVIVVDDAYPGPEDLAPLAEVAGIALVRNPVNLGFLRTCNAAAARARGEFLYLLNSDAELRPGAVDALVTLLRTRPDVALAGSKLLFPDGSLQEAGGILWRDALGWNFGRGADPQRPEFEYLRETDYCSGASVLVRRSVWDELGGFDEAFAPAYYEDVDLAFRIRARGLKVMYEPRSVVVHHEGVSHGDDVTSGPKARIPVNQQTMRTVWREELARHFPIGEHVLRARDRGWGRRVVLVIDRSTPQSGTDATADSVLAVMAALVAADCIVKFWPLDGRHEPLHAGRLERMGVEVIDERSPDTLDSWMGENGDDLDHVLVVGPDVAEASLSWIVRDTDAVLSYYDTGQGFDGANRAPGVGQRRLWRRFDLVLCRSEADLAALRSANPAARARAIAPSRMQDSVLSALLEAEAALTDRDLPWRSAGRPSDTLSEG